MSSDHRRNLSKRSVRSSTVQQRSNQIMASPEEYNLESVNQMIYGLRVAELNTFLSEHGASRSGRKHELQMRAIELAQNLTPSMYNSLRRLYTSRQMSSNSYSSNNASNHDHFGLPSGNSSHAGRSSKSSRSTLSSFGFNRAQPPSLQPMMQESNASSNYASMLSLNEINNYFSHPSSLLGGPSFKDQNSGPNNPKYASSTVAANVWSVPPSIPESPMADVVFAKLPFYEEIATLIAPTNLLPTTQSATGRPSLQEFTTQFTLTADHANAISTSRKVLPLMDAFSPQPKVEFGQMLLLRFALTNNATQDEKIVEDIFPPSLCLKINSKIPPLPPTLPVNKASHPKDAFKPARPVDITPHIKISPLVANPLVINWYQPALSYNPTCVDHSKRFAFALYLVKKVSPDDLVTKVKAKGIKSTQFTKSIIMDKLQDEDMEIATTFLRASLQCPLGKMRIRLPGRSLNCTHIQCFDLQFFIQMNEKKPTWLCPVCDKKIPFDTLVIDGLFTEILASEAAAITNEVQFIKNNNSVEWSPIVKEEKKPKVEPPDPHGDHVSPSSSGEKRRSEIDSSGYSSAGPSGSKRKKPEPEIITLDSDDDDEPGPTRTSSSNPSGNPSIVEMFNLSDEEDGQISSMPESFAAFQAAVMQGFNETNLSTSSLGTSNASKRPLGGHNSNPFSLSLASFNSRSGPMDGGASTSAEPSGFHSNYSIESLSLSSRSVPRSMQPLNSYDDDDDDIAIIE